MWMIFAQDGHRDCSGGCGSQNRDELCGKAGRSRWKGEHAPPFLRGYCLDRVLLGRGGERAKKHAPLEGAYNVPAKVRIPRLVFVSVTAFLSLRA
jgi:hypothetical protein